jgi:hypothetical protein
LPEQNNVDAAFDVGADMKKIAVLGCGGSGKSHVARILGKALDAPVTHLDAVYYDSDWNELPMPEFEARQRALVAEPTWVIDGNYNSTLPVRLQRCDTVVFLDLPGATCLWGAVWRQLRRGTGQNAATGSTTGCTWVSFATSAPTGERCAPRCSPRSMNMPSTPPSSR